MKTGHQFTGRTNLIRAAYHCTRPPSYTTIGLTMYLATRYWASGGQQGSRPLRHYSIVRPNNLPGDKYYVVPPNTNNMHNAYLVSLIIYAMLSDVNPHYL